MNSPARKNRGDAFALPEPAPMDPERTRRIGQLLAAGWIVQRVHEHTYVRELFAAHEFELNRAAALEERVRELETALRRVGETTLGQALALASEHKDRADTLNARVRQLEERCALDAEDIREHRVTRAHVEAWASSHGWSRVIRARVTDERGATWWERAGKRDIQVRDGANTLAYNIDEFSVADNRNAWDVLREIAAIPGTTN
jgi:hypothetical protein